MASTIVIGGGVIGCAIAERLARDGHQVTLLERDRVGAHASGAAAGLLAPHSELWGSEELAELAARSSALFPELADRLQAETGIDIEYRQGESLRLAFDESEVKQVRSLVERLRGRGIAADWLDPAGVRELEPQVSAEIAGASRTREAQLTPIRFVEALARAAAVKGADIRQATSAFRLLTEGRRVDGVRVLDGRLHADWVVVAAGPWSAEVVAAAGLELDVRPRRGQLVALAPDRPLLARILNHDRYYLVPKPDGSIVAGSTEEESGFDARATLAGVRELLAVGEASVPGLRNASVNRVWAGIRPWTPSGMPRIGPFGGYENLVVATGHHRDGILLAPVTAELVAQGLAHGWPAFEDAAAHRP